MRNCARHMEECVGNLIPCVMCVMKCTKALTKGKEVVVVVRRDEKQSASHGATPQPPACTNAHTSLEAL